MYDRRVESCWKMFSPIHLDSLLAQWKNVEYNKKKKEKSKEMEGKNDNNSVIRELIVFQASPH